MMDQGFHHPDLGYWQTTDVVSQATLNGYPDGTITVPLKPNATAEFVNGVWVDQIPDINEWRTTAEISQAQARLTLYQLGLLATVQAIADADPAASIVWEYADVIKRNSPFIDGLGAAAFTPTQIDDIFVYAQALIL